MLPGISIEYEFMYPYLPSYAGAVPEVSGCSIPVVSSPIPTIAHLSRVVSYKKATFIPAPSSAEIGRNPPFMVLNMSSPFMVPPYPQLVYDGDVVHINLQLL